MRLNERLVALVVFRAVARLAMDSTLAGPLVGRFALRGQPPCSYALGADCQFVLFALALMAAIGVLVSVAVGKSLPV